MKSRNGGSSGRSIPRRKNRSRRTRLDGDNARRPDHQRFRTICNGLTLSVNGAKRTVIFIRKDPEGITMRWLRLSGFAALLASPSVWADEPKPASNSYRPHRTIGRSRPEAGLTRRQAIRCKLRCRVRGEPDTRPALRRNAKPPQASAGQANLDRDGVISSSNTPGMINWLSRRWATPVLGWRWSG